MNSLSDVEHERDEALARAERAEEVLQLFMPKNPDEILTSVDRKALAKIGAWRGDETGGDYAPWLAELLERDDAD